jgi:hypothetical protein
MLRIRGSTKIQKHSGLDFMPYPSLSASHKAFAFKTIPKTGFGRGYNLMLRIRGSTKIQKHSGWDFMPYPRSSAFIRVP